MAAVLPPGGSVAAEDRPAPEIAVASAPDRGRVSGGDALLRVTAPGSGKVRVTVNGHTADGFVRQPDGSHLGLVSGLKDGPNRITARSRGRTATRTLINHRTDGPVFAGPQPLPFYCETTAFGLAPAHPPYCSAPTRVSYKYRSKAGEFAPLADPARRPSDLADTTVDGRKVPYIVRVETGTIDRAVYETAALYDGTDPSPLRQEQGWNDRLVYVFGGGCAGGHHQGAQTGGVLNDLFLSQGYAVASSTLNVLETNCNIPTSAEAAMTVKEHFTETYGPPAHTIGWGGSGGGIQQYTIADAYPGILDGIIPTVGFPDTFTPEKAASDCQLLVRYFAGAGSSLTPAQWDAVAGFLEFGTCIGMDQGIDLRHPTVRCDKSIPLTARWHATANPGGVKCTLMEAYANQFGRDPGTGFVRSTLDNVGVQYGLQALNAEQITPDQFIALNAAIGGYDAQGAPSPRRSQADPQALETAYRDDLLNSMSLGLRSTPIIDHRVYMDRVPLDVHTAQWSYVVRARLKSANGTTANHVIIESQLVMAATQTADTYVLASMDRWLTAITADTSTRGKQAKTAANKPADLSDACYLTPGNRVHTTLTYPASGPCAADYPIGSDPRMQAGEPLAQTCAPRTDADHLHLGARRLPGGALPPDAVGRLVELGLAVLRLLDP
ncbi:DUF6351 family protein [Streptomyces sp. NBC_01264]|uniref:DUF6351 family protein n=1 Tax=Streptomyces sp. NBC_01264 TaxID=2903804 RepID=UPI00224FF6CD|nr:DUF6351 family protein [Streptomyces sp. NBC_01264]MCX4775465.1 DUF6351 family protein [Streptomyces sp. NBC_01264]